MNHVRSIHFEDKSWCEEILKPSEFHFKSLEQAVLNGMYPSKIATCAKCVDKIIVALMKSRNPESFHVEQKEEDKK